MLLAVRCLVVMIGVLTIEQHSRYGNQINSDDLLYLVAMIAFTPVDWINSVGYRQLANFEVHAM